MMTKTTRFVDLNEQLHQHQVAAIKARMSGHEAERQSHFDLVSVYAERIRALRQESNVVQYSWPAGQPVADNGNTFHD